MGCREPEPSSRAGRRIVTIHLPSFGLQAHARGEPGLDRRPLAREGDPPRGRIVEVSRLAREQGVEPGQSLAQARAACCDLVVVRVDEATLSGTRVEIVEALLPIVARLEWAGGGTFHAEGQGLVRLHGSEPALLARCVEALRARGLHARAASAPSRFSSLLAARTRSGIASIPEGGERAFLAELPIRLAPLPENVLARLDLLSVRTLSDLAGLPEDGLADRFGREVARVQRLVRGEENEPLTALPDPQAPHAARELDEPISGIEPVTFLLKSCCEDLAEELDRRGMAAARIELRITRDDPPGGDDVRVVEPARPLATARELLSLCRLEIEARPLASALIGFVIAATVLAPRKGLGGELFGRSFDIASLSAALDKVRLLLGPDRVATPSPRPAHRREARVGWERFDAAHATRHGIDTTHATRHGIAPEAGAERVPSARLLERPIPAFVQLPEEGPGQLLMPAAEGLRLGFPGRVELARASGPTRISGEWWDGGADVDRDEYLLHGVDGDTYLAARDRRTKRWQVQGWLD